MAYEKSGIKVDIFDELANRIKARKDGLIVSFKDYFKRLLFPIYLFPIKLVTYTFYYFVTFIIKLIFALISLAFLQ